MSGPAPARVGRVAVLVGGAALVLTGCQGGPAVPTSAPPARPTRAASARTAPLPRASFTEAGMRVAATLTGGGVERSLVVTFSPPAGFHLYGLDLPADGIDGLGRPTRVRAGAGLVASGPPVADRPVRSFRPAGLDTVLPVYPAGPVTITVAVRVDSRVIPVIEVSYAACSQQVCLPPVRAHPMTLATTVT